MSSQLELVHMCSVYTDPNLVLTSSLHLVMILDSSKKTGNHALCHTLSVSSRL